MNFQKPEIQNSDYCITCCNMFSTIKNFEFEFEWDWECIEKSVAYNPVTSRDHSPTPYR